MHKEIVTDLANTMLSRLISMQLMFKLLLEVGNVHLGGRLWRYISDPELAVIHVFIGRKDCIQMILISLSFSLCLILLLQGTFLELSRDQIWIVVLKQ